MLQVDWLAGYKVEAASSRVDLLAARHAPPSGASRGSHWMYAALQAAMKQPGHVPQEAWAKPIGSSSHPPRRRGLKRPSKFGGLGDLRRRSETCRIGRGTAGAGDRISLAASCRPRSQLHPAGGLR
jgi:hypothetical protein